MKPKTINWTALAAIGQILSAVAVAMTLLSLTMQTRRAEIAASDANRLARADGVISFWLAAMHDPEFREAGLRINPAHAEWTAEISRRMEISVEDANLLQSETLYWFWLHWGQWSTSTEQKDIEELIKNSLHVLSHKVCLWHCKACAAKLAQKKQASRAAATLANGRGAAKGSLGGHRLASVGPSWPPNGPKLVDVLPKGGPRWLKLFLLASSTLKLAQDCPNKPRACT